MGKKIVNQKSVLIQTKISPAIDSRLDRICKEYGFSSKYELLQNLVSAFLKYADPESGEQDISESDRFSLELAKIFTELQNKQGVFRCGQVIHPFRVNTIIPTSGQAWDCWRKVYIRKGW